MERINGKELTAAEITNKALEILKAQGHRVRRVNNVGVYKKRSHQVEPGWPDIQGYSSKGVVILCEVKKIGDTLKPAQKERLIDCKSCGGIAMIATQREEFYQMGGIELLSVEDFLWLHGIKIKEI